MRICENCGVNVEADAKAGRLCGRCADCMLTLCLKCAPKRKFDNVTCRHCYKYRDKKMIMLCDKRLPARTKKQEAYVKKVWGQYLKARKEESFEEALDFAIEKTRKKPVGVMDRMISEFIGFYSAYKLRQGRGEPCQ